MPWLEPQTWDWATLTKTAVGAGFGTALVQAFLAIYRDARHRKSHAAYMAMRLAVILEAFASACSGLVYKNSNAECCDREFPDWQAKLPELFAYPDDTEGWRAIDRKLAGRCLSLRNKIDNSQNIIWHTVEYFEDERGDVFDEEAARRGLEAWSLAVDLRRKHSIEEADIVGNCAEHLKVALHRSEQAQVARRQM